jgi:hypothetical protein
MVRRVRQRNQVSQYTPSAKNMLIDGVIKELFSPMEYWAKSQISKVHDAQEELTGDRPFYYKNNTYYDQKVAPSLRVSPLVLSLHGLMEEIDLNRERVQKESVFVKDYLSNRLLTAHDYYSMYYLVPISIRDNSEYLNKIRTHLNISDAKDIGLKPESSSLFDKKFEEVVAKYIGFNALFGGQV